jgi:AraC-like DNA-binding protein
MIYTIGVVIAFFLALIILTKQGRNFADKILGIWMILIGFHLFVYYSIVSGLLYQYPDILWLNLPYPFLHGPMLYLYTLALTNPEKFKNKTWLLHFILPVFIVVLYAPAMLKSKDELVSQIKNGATYVKTLRDIVGTVLLSCSGFFYVFITNRLLTRHKKRILNQFSNQEKINLNWLRMLFYGMGLMWILIIFVGHDPLIFSAASVFTIFIGYYGIKQVGIFTNQYSEIADNESIEEVSVEDFNPEKKKYAKSGLNEEAAQELHLKLRGLMTTEKLYTQSELTLTELANRLEIHPNYLSQIINEMEGMNFYDYINGLRIEEFKRLVALPENQKFTLLALAFDCGFNSKTAFNRFFKKVTNLSPSEYVKQIS